MSSTAKRAPPEGAVTNQEAALRRVATLVAQRSPPVEIFAAVTEEACRVLATEAVGLLRFETDGTATLVAQSDTPWHPPPLGTSFTLDGENVVAQVFRSGRAARVDDWTGSTGSVAAMASVLGVRSAVASPVAVEGRSWGTIVAATSQPEPLPVDTESRIEQFTELVGIAISNAESRDALTRLAEEQAALRRVATLVAESPDSEELFSAVARELASCLDVHGVIVDRFEPDGSQITLGSAYDLDLEGADSFLGVGVRLPLQPGTLAAAILETGRTARVEDYSKLQGLMGEAARAAAIGSGCAAPIIVDGRLWGQMCVFSSQGTALPAGTERRLDDFVGLVATAISNYDARAGLRALADEQAALRRVATLVAGGLGPQEVFGAVAAEVGVLIGADVSAIVRFEDDGTVTVLGDVGGPHVSGKRVTLDEGYVVHRVRETSRSARFDTDDPWGDGMPSLVRALGIRSSVASPIVVEGELWGAITAGSAQGPLPSSAERRLSEFTELVATAVANTQARERVTSLADEQAALRRVATLVAIEASQGDVFTAIAEGVSGVVGAELRLWRFEGELAVVVASSGGPHQEVFPVGTRIPVGGENAVSRVFRTSAPARIEDYSHASGPIAEAVRSRGLRSSLATPIIVDGRLWGAMLVGAFGTERTPPDIERRLAEFTELMATAIANAEAREEIARLAEQQAALRRVATLVARGVAPEVVFRAVADEAGGLLGADFGALVRLESDDIVTVMAGPTPGPHAEGARVTMEPGFVVHAIRETGRTARFETDDPAAEGMPELVRRTGIRSAVASPIAVEGALWGAVILGSLSAPFPPETEQRLDEFTELVATGISNATARTELIASRARIVAAGDEARRRIERNLHDSTQQRLIALGLDLQRTRTAVPEEQRDTHTALETIEHDLEGILVDLRELSHGLHPPLLARFGLGPSLQALARRSPIPVHLDVELPERPAASVETAMYYVVSEAVTNAVKHSRASEILVTIASDGKLQASVVDDGIGGADPTGGSGLTGLFDRVDALGGRFAFESPPRGGTRISIELPVEPTVAS